MQDVRQMAHIATYERGKICAQYSGNFRPYKLPSASRSNSDEGILEADAFKRRAETLSARRTARLDTYDE